MLSNCEETASASPDHVESIQMPPMSQPKLTQELLDEEVRKLTRKIPVYPETEKAKFYMTSFQSRKNPTFKSAPLKNWPPNR
jgi:hypothetical protein